MKLVSIPANPVPDNFVTGALKTPDGVTLRFARWLPPAGRRGTVCIFQGRSEWIEKYFETVRDLRARGFAVASLDWRGQGLSDRALKDRRKGYVRNFADYDLDLETFMREVVLPDCPPPIFAIGHSTGATVLIRAAHRAGWRLLCKRHGRGDCPNAAASRFRVHVCAALRHQHRRIPSLCRQYP